MKKIFLSLCLLAAAGMMYAQAEYYVSVDGKDSNAGTERKPFLTLKKALEEARKESGEVVVFMREGVHRLDETIVLAEADGHEGKKLCIRSYPGEKVVVSGGKELEPKWKTYKDGIVQAKVDD